MWCKDIAVALTLANVDIHAIRECAARHCTNKFRFCAGGKCYLEALPKEAMWSA